MRAMSPGKQVARGPKLLHKVSARVACVFVGVPGCLWLSVGQTETDRQTYRQRQTDRQTEKRPDTHHGNPGSLLNQQVARMSRLTHIFEIGPKGWVCV